MNFNLSFTNLMGGIIFGSIGLFAFMYGKKQASFRMMGIGIVLMAFPYFVSNTVAVYAIGVILTVVLYLFRE